MKRARFTEEQIIGILREHEAELCNPASGWEKGQIEKNVQDARHRLWYPMPNVPSLAALNDRL